jgi:hypothetical protein
MTRIVLRLANFPLLVLLACVLISVQSTLFISFPLNWLQPDLLLALVIWVALKRGFLEGGVLTLIFGYLLELHSSAPRGTFLSCTMFVFLGVRLAARVLVLPDFHSWIRLTLVASIGWKMAGLLVLAALDKADLQWRHTLIHLFPGAVMTGLAGTWTYRLLDRTDKATHKDLRLEQRLTDDVRLVENEGI